MSYFCSYLVSDRKPQLDKQYYNLYIYKIFKDDNICKVKMLSFNVFYYAVRKHWRIDILSIPSLKLEMIYWE